MQTLLSDSFEVKVDAEVMPETVPCSYKTTAKEKAQPKVDLPYLERSGM
jgi:hypothetical protein